MELLKAIEETAEQRCREAREKADEEVRRIEAATEEQIQSLRESARQESQRKLRREETVLVAEAETKVQRESARVKSELIDRAMEKARERLSRVAGAEDYPKIFEKLAGEALTELREGFTAVVRPEDADLARKTLEALGAKDFDVSTDGGILGGLSVVSRDGRTRVVNTFDSRFEKVREQAILRIAPILFG